MYCKEIGPVSWYLNLKCGICTCDVLTRRKDKRVCLDCKVIPGECVVSQHKLLVADFRFQVRAHRDKQAKIERTKWWKLKGETSEVFRERVIKERS